jgi:hypothetical protein
VRSFRSTLSPGGNDLVPAKPEMIERASNWFNGLHLDNSTNFEIAMKAALKRPRVNLVVFITDGVPMRGETNRRKLTRLIRQENVNRARIFTIGLVGKDLEGKDRTFQARRLLQQISSESGGQYTEYPLG